MSSTATIPTSTSVSTMASSPFGFPRPTTAPVLSDSGTANAALMFGPFIGGTVLICLAAAYAVRRKRRLRARQASIEAASEDKSPSASRPDLWDAYVKSETASWDYTTSAWTDIKPVSVAIESSAPSSEDHLECSAERPERTLMSAARIWKKKSRSSTGHARPEHARLQVAVLIAMPSPPRTPFEKRASFVSTRASEETVLPLENAGGTGDLNVALGMTDIPVFLSQR